MRCSEEVRRSAEEIARGGASAKPLVGDVRREVRNEVGEEEGGSIRDVRMKERDRPRPIRT
jgi:hypothetical protein